ncbi:MAG: LCP family protein [Eubacterium sp.]
MKKQIDPNLNSNNNDIDLLLDEILTGNGNSEGEFSDSEQQPAFEIKQKAPEEAVRHRRHRSSNSSNDTGVVSGTSHHSGSHSSHRSSHHSSSKKKKKMPLIVRILIVLLAIIVAAVGAMSGIYYFYKTSGENDLTSVAKSDVQHEEILTYKGHKYEFNKDVVSIAFIGVDQRELANSDNADFVGCADAVLVVAIDTKTGSAKLISLPRDTMVDVDQYRGSAFIKTDRVQLCLAYAYGDGKDTSCKNVTKAVSRILYNVPIDKYYALELDGIKPLNDAVGGVTVDALYDLPEYGIKKGETVTLKGDMAEAYVRTRDMDRIDAALDRKIRQEQYIKAFANQLLPKVKDDFGVISRLYNTASSYSQTNISINNITYLASLMLSKNITDFETYTYTGELSESKDSVYPDVVHAELTPDEDSLMQTVLDVYYTQIS